ncbi:hypothetical protein FRB96_001412 [Tulasnella sp. 330]|nr:hypothetical protein FRB96_001412 [Tulasnella sp. 330]
MAITHKGSNILEIERLIDRLGYGDSGVAKKLPCLTGTREPVLARIKRWIEEPSSKHCFSLFGAAGTGKSAIAVSIANQEKGTGRLGAGFYFTRDEQARNKGAILVLARQLANWGDRRLRSDIASAVQEEPDIGQMTAEYQFQKLIQDPLEAIDTASPTLLIILDALDECDMQYATTLLCLFGKGVAELPPQVKLFVSSRGAPHIQACYGSEPLNSHLETHSLSDEKIELVDNDINSYFKERLPELVGQWVEEPLDWPGEERRRSLVRMSERLFIWATTVAGMLADPNFRDPEKQLQALLSSDSMTNLDRIYAKILDRACSSTVSQDVLARFRSVLGALVVAPVPINTHTLSSLTRPDDDELDRRAFTNRIRVTVLVYLQAVLIVPDVEKSDPAQDAHPIRFIHTSFVDYLTDKSRCDPRFYIDLSDQHRQLAIICFGRLQDLRRNMCDLDPSLLNWEVEGLEKKVNDCIPAGLRYACANVATHVSRAPTNCTDIHRLVREFVGKRLMNWLEGLSLMGRTHEAVGMAALIEFWLKAAQTPPSSLELMYPAPKARPGSAFVIDFERLATTFAQLEPSRMAVLFFAIIHLFMAGLLSRLQGPSSPSTTFPSIDSSPHAQTLALLNDFRRFVMEFMDPISASSLHIYYSALPFTPSRTSLSRRYCRPDDGGPKVIRGQGEIWSHTLWTASKHSNSINCIAVSPDSQTIVSGSADFTMRLWDADDGAPIGKAIRGHSDAVNCLSVSPDGRFIVSGSADRTLRMWDASTGSSVGNAMEGHSDTVNCVAVSPDSRRIVSGSSDKTLCLWDATTRTSVGPALKGHTQWVKCVAVYPDGKTIISGSFDSTIRRWNATTGALVGDAMRGHSLAVTCIAVTPNGKTIISGSSDQSLRLWDATSGAPVGGPIRGHTDYVRCLVVSTDGKMIVSGSEDRTLRRWDVTTGAPVADALEGHSHGVRCLASSADGSVIVSGSSDKTLRRWDVSSSSSHGNPLSGHNDMILCLAVSPNGKVIVSGSYDQTLRLWNAITGAPMGMVMRGHSGPVICLAISPNGRTVISGSMDNTLRLWDGATGASVGKVLTGHTNHVRCLAVFPNGKLIVSGSYDKTLRMWNAITGEPVGNPMKGHSDTMTCVAVCPRGKMIVSGSRDKSLRLWDAATGASVGKAMLGHTDQVRCLAVSPDGKIVVSGSYDKTVRLWNAVTGEAVGKVMRGHSEAVDCVAMFPDGRKIASGSRDATVRMWDISTGESVGEAMKGHTDAVHCLAVLPNGKKIASGSHDRTLRIWDVNSGTSVGRVMKEHSDRVTCLAVSPGGNVIVTGSGDRTLRLWNATESAAPENDIVGHSNWINCFAVSPDGKIIVSGSYDRTIRLWDAVTGAPVGTVMEGHSEPVTCIVVSPDGTIVASGSWDKTVRLWNGTTGAAIGDAMEGHSGSITSVTFSPDGRFVVSRGERPGSPEVIVWDASSQQRVDGADLSMVLGDVVDQPPRMFRLNNHGWLRDERGKRMFWVPTGLRARMDVLGNVLALYKPTVPLIDVSAYVS